MAYNNTEIAIKVRREFNLLFFREDYNCYSIADIEISKLNANEKSCSKSEFGITDFIVNETDDKIIIEIGLTRPGSFIGAKGLHYEMVTDYLTRKLQKQVKINLFESKMFNFNIKSEQFKIKSDSGDLFF